ncbi:hypothetical protein [Streptomyces maoxianensis]
MAVERGVGETWQFHTHEGARLALASRPPDEVLVRPEALADLPQMRPTLKEAFQRAGLLAPARARLVPVWMSKGRGSCCACLAWTNEADQLCPLCRAWGDSHRAGPCHRCGRVLGLRDGYCRRCLLFLAETEYDIDNIHLTGGDQLWFGGPFAPRMRLGYRGQEGSLFGRRRHDARRLRAVRTSRAARPVSTHLALPGQLEMFHLVRDWSRLNEQRLPALLPGARRLLTDFVAHFRRRGWKESNLAPNVRTLRMLLAHLGAEAPLWEEDVRLLARRDDFTGARVINYLRLTGRLVPDQRASAALAHARRLADAAPEPFRAPLHQWIDVLCGTGAPPSSSLAPTTIGLLLHRANHSEHGNRPESRPAACFQQAVGAGRIDRRSVGDGAEPP